MSEKGSAPFREFHLVEEQGEALKLLKESSRNLASAMIWTREQQHVVSSHVSLYDDEEKLLYAWIPTGTDPAAFAAELARIGSQDCFFSVSLSRANIFFKARYIGHDERGFRFEAPDKIYKVQRRKALRFMVPFGHVIRVELENPVFPDQKLSKKIFDISAGGLSFVATQEEAALFQVGITLKDVTFSIRSRKLTVDLEVRHLRAHAPDSAQPGYKVGTSFAKIRDADREWIVAYVFEESRKYFTKLV